MSNAPVYPNPLVKLSRIAGLLIILSLVTGGVYLAYPKAAGQLRQEYIKREAYDYDEFHFRRASFSFRAGPGRIFPVYQNGEITGAVFLGPGDYSFAGPPRVSGSLDKAYMSMSYTDFQEIRGSTGARFTGDLEGYREARELIGLAYRNRSARPFGVTRYFPESTSSIAVAIDGLEGPAVYEEDLTPTFSFEDKTVAFEPLPGEYEGNPSFVVAIFLYSAVALIFILLLELLFPVRHGEGPKTGLKEPIILSSLILAAAALDPTAEFYPGLMPVFYGSASLLWIAARRDLALPRRLLAGLAVGILIGLFGTLAGSLVFPKGLRLFDAFPYGVLAETFLLKGLLPALFYFYVLRRALRSHAGPWSVPVVALIAAAVYAIRVSSSALPPPEFLWVDVYLGVFLPFLVAGWAHEKTGSLAAPVLALSTWAVLPSILVF